MPSTYGKWDTAYRRDRLWLAEYFIYSLVCELDEFSLFS
jgi:hypothetical protein